VTVTVSAPSPQRRQSVTVLLVDDQPIIGESVRQMLAQEPYIAFHHCADARQAVETALRVAPTVILQDLVMPHVDGLELVRRYREDDRLREIPLIVLSTKEEPAVKAEAFRLGANDYLVKLPSPIELVARIRYHSGAFRNARQRKLAYDALVESQEQLRLRNEEIERQRDSLEKQAAELEKRNRFIRKTFGRYLSDEVVASLLESPEGLRLGGESRVLTILMSDLRGFTSQCERLPAESVVRMLNNYLGTMADVITSYRGTIDEFIGDAVLAIFGAPLSGDDDAERAVACAIAMQQAMDSVNRQNLQDGLPLIEMGIALHTGEVVVGNIGSTTRAKYGIVGSHVNLTARIESMSVGGQVLLSDSTRLAAGSGVSVGGRIAVRAKGFQEPITAWDLRGVAGRHDLWMPTESDVLVTLEKPIEIRFAQVKEKQVEEDVERGRIVRLSTKRAEVVSQHALAPLTNLRIRVLGDDGVELAADLYAKVMATPAERAGAFLVRFSPPPRELVALFVDRIGTRATP